ncbi:MAG: large subunit ribosomal protein L25 [Parasphingorhabdus sp.]|jgi:large subunit ribosomal protein L25
MSEYQVNAELRETTGTSDSRRLRHANRVPAVVYGSGKDNTLVTLEHDVLMHQLAEEGFHAAIIDLKSGSKSEQVILREVQMHPYKPRVMHVDFQRVRATDKMHMNVPLHFVGDDVCPGVKNDGGIISHLLNEVDVSCLPKDLPEYLEVDVSALNLNESLHLSDLAVPEGVEITSLSHEGGDHTVVAVLAPKVQSDDTAAGEGDDAAAGDTAAES